MTSFNDVDGLNSARQSMIDSTVARCKPKNQDYTLTLPTPLPLGTIVCWWLMLTTLSPSPLPSRSGLLYTGAAHLGRFHGSFWAKPAQLTRHLRKWVKF